MRIEISRGGFFTVKRTSVLVTLLISVGLLTTSCGTSDSVRSLTLSTNAASSGGFFNLVGADGTLQLVVTDNYRSGKTVISTNQATFTVTTVGSDQDHFPLPPYGPDSVPISTTGLMTAVGPLCTWVDLDDPKTGDPQSPPVWAYTGYYQVVAHHDGLDSQPVAIGVGSLVSDTSPVGGCGPS
jgi:hypothetical protein